MGTHGGGGHGNVYQTQLLARHMGRATYLELVSLLC